MAVVYNKYAFVKKKLNILKKSLKGELFTDNLHRIIYATDASVYRMLPLAVIYPKNENDVKKTIVFANKNHVSLTARTAGTSLAGQCVTNGIILDFSKYFTSIISVDKTEKIVTVEPGVIRDSLNKYLKPYGFFFGPNTSTSNRCMIGGMLGNNSSGTTSIKYGVTRDKVISIEGFLSNGSKTVFKKLSQKEFAKKLEGNTFESKIYQKIHTILSKIENQKEILNNFPKSSIHRRNTGYALDALLNFSLFGGNENHINLSKLICGSEGTLFIATKIKLKLEVLPPKNKVMVVSHFNSVKESLKAVQTAMKHNLFLCELMDKTILDCTKNNRKQAENRFFIQGNPQAVLMLEIKNNTLNEATEDANKLIADLKKHQFGYAHVLLKNEQVDKIIELRKAGLGLLGNIIGDKKSVACIEDTAVSLDDLPNYIDEFSNLMNGFKQKAIYYAHAGAGELHLRPILNLKEKEDVKLFRKITTQTAKLVKKYKGSFSGEHGDGIVRSEFIPLMIGTKNYSFLKEIKTAFDPKSILNKGKIIDPIKMDTNLRLKKNQNDLIKTQYNFNDNIDIKHLAEKCNGSGDCRKSTNAGGVMCPSYRATKNEKDTTRARANTLREILNESTDRNKFNNPVLKEVFDLCISCKACSNECPSNVDVAILKSEFLYQFYKSNKRPLRDFLFVKNTLFLKIAGIFPEISNAIINSNWFKKRMGIATDRKLPKPNKQSFSSWLQQQNQREATKKVYLFADEFTDNFDVELGKDTFNLLTKLGYQILYVKHFKSGRAELSKGFLKEAKSLANKNISIFSKLVSNKTPLIGIEPSAILSFRDEYLRLANNLTEAKKLSKNTYTIEEFIANEIDKGCITEKQFRESEKKIKIHTHCHQKALSKSNATFIMLNIPKNYKVTILNTGCCGMAGAFGYEKEHYAISMQIGENSVFKKVRNQENTIEIAVSGTSCRHQITDGTGLKTKHPVSILLDALK